MSCSVCVEPQHRTEATFLFYVTVCVSVDRRVPCSRRRSVSLVALTVFLVFFFPRHKARECPPAHAHATVTRHSPHTRAYKHAHTLYDSCVRV